MRPTGGPRMRTTRKATTAGAFPPFVAGRLVTPAAAPAAVVINEVESDGGAGAADWVELTNTGAAAADIGGYVLKDSDDGHVLTLAPGTSIPAHGYFAVDVDGPGGFGLGANDA